MVLKLNKWGNSLGLRIPSALAARFELVDGLKVELQATEEGILVSPVKQQLDLEYLLTGATEDNQHPEILKEI
ncbi:AbrB/MazE/SpoVT family DNA-binding domain-containing protein [Lewinellaceae bacterium SD302]|nr:AbrB/MazE/SpoVT family DNA-binding domain-containing protein [Lewinellaceae bacterium SD302]